MAARTAISAALDEVVDEITRERVDAHLAGCPSCRGWQELAHVVTRRARINVVAPAASLAAQVTAAVRVDMQRRRARRYWLAVARAVVGVGLLQLLATVPLLLMARSHTSGGSRVHLLGLIELAIGAGFFIGALVVLWRERDQRVIELVQPAHDDRHGHHTGVSEVA